MRQSGYYWVRLNADWHIGFYSENHKRWFLIGADVSHLDSDFLEIDETQITRQ